MTPVSVAYHRPWLYPAQEAALFAPARYAIVEASTKSGKTVGALAWLVEQAILHGRPGRNYWWVAPIYPQAAIAYRRLKRMLPVPLFHSNEGDLTMTLTNGAILWFKSGEKPDNLYGEDVHAAVVDEASRVREEAWHAVRTTLTATRGPCRIIGNVRGRRNWAYALARRAEAGEPGYHYARITAHDAVAAGVLTADEIADARRQLPDSVFRELYLAEASEDVGNPFGLAAIDACTGPLASTEPYAWGWDLARAQDWCVGIALDRDGATCRFERFQRPWEETFQAVLGNVKPAALIDSTGVGDPIVDRLQRQVGGVAEGYHYTRQSKQQLMEGLAAAIQGREVSYPEGPIAAELREFEYTYTAGGVLYSAPAGYYDDCVNGLALAVECRRRQEPGTSPMPGVRRELGRRQYVWRNGR